MSANDLQHLNARITLLEDMLTLVVNLSKPEIQLTTRDLLQRRQAADENSAGAFVSLSEQAQEKQAMRAYIVRLLEKLDLPAPINNS